MWFLIYLLTPCLSFLHSLFIGLDANFRLKRRNISSSAADPSLSKGWSYFVDEDDFKDFLGKFDSLVVQKVCILFSIIVSVTLDNITITAEQVFKSRRSQ